MKDKVKGKNLKRLLSFMLTLAMVITLIPFNSITAYADDIFVEDKQEAETVSEDAPTPLTFTAEEANSSVTFKYSSGSEVKYKKNSDGEWTNCPSGTKIDLNKDDTVSFKGTNVTTNAINHFSMTGKIAASGDINSLTNEKGGDATLTNDCYQYMFSDCTSLTSAPELPATTLASNCYYYMFYNCTSLTSAPKLTATTLASECYSNMFKGCTSLTSAPKLTATTLASSCYSNMFQNCTNLTSAPELPATTLASSCYSNMFQNCTNLTSAPELPATTLASSCYDNMFKGCTSLTSAPELPATELKDNCYECMFEECTSLTSAPTLPATTLAESCYNGMFYGCTSLTSAPTLPATTLAESCYNCMFCICTSLTSAPKLPATTLANSCYQGMFYGCTSLTSAPKLPATTLAESCYSYMFYGCKNLKIAETTDKEKAIWIFPNDVTASDWNADMISDTSGTAKTVEEGKMYRIITPLTFTAEEANSSITFKYSSGSEVKYSTDKGSSWQDYSKDNTITLTNIGDTVSFKGKDVTTNNSNHFFMTGKIAASGDVTSLTNGTGGDATLAESCYKFMFYNCTSLTSAPALPATKLANYCYQYMFYNCTSLTSAPELKATILANYCYQGMFNGCTSLTSAPELPATTLANYCYSYMFQKCTNLTSTPALSAKTLVDYCYDNMFNGCTSLTSAPTLPATTLANYCYNGMFFGCTSLTSAPELPATELKESCYNSMFYGCTKLTSTPALSAKTLAKYCYSNMFNGCTSLTSAPALPATTLASNCYYYMFNGCTSLTSAPTLPATTLAESCYSYMFYGCYNLEIEETTDKEKAIWIFPSNVTASNWNTDMILYTSGTATAVEAGKMYRIMPSHEHKWTYTSNDATLTAKCTGDEDCTVTDGKTTGISLTLSASSKTYDGTAVTATVGTTDEQTAWTEAGLTVPTDIKYYKATDKDSTTESGDALTSAPKDAGNYVAEIKAGDATAKKAFSISKAELTIDTATIADKTYDGKKIATVNSVTFRGLKNDETLTKDTDYTVSGEFDKTDATGTNAASKVTVTVALNDTEKANNYSLNENTKKIQKNITKADGSSSVALEGWTYGETAKTPAPTSETNGTTSVTYQYKVKDKDDSTYTTTVPTNAGEYTVKATFAATDNYNEVSKTADFTIAKAKVEVPTAVSNLVYNGEEQTGVVLPKDAKYTLSVNIATNAGTYNAIATLKDNTNYEWDGKNTSNDQKIEWSIAKAKVEVPTAVSNLVYNGEEQTGVELPTDANYTLSDNKKTNAGTYTATASLKDKTNYEWNGKNTSNDQKIEWSIAKKSITVTAEDKSSYIGDKQNDLTYKTEGLIGEDKITAGSLKLDKDFDNTKAGTFDIVEDKTFSAGDNYEIKFKKGTYTVKERPYIPSGGGAASETEKYTIPVKSEDTVQIGAEITDGSAKVEEITKESLETVVSKEENAKDTVTIDLSGAKQDVTGVVITKQSVENLAETVKDETNKVDTVEIKMTNATVTLDEKTLDALKSQAQGDTIRLVVDETQPEKQLNQNQTEALSEKKVAQTFEAYFESNGQRIHDFNGGSATVAVKFAPETGRDAKYYHVYYASTDGKLQKYATKYENGNLKFTTGHFSDYAIVYDESEENETYAHTHDLTKVEAKAATADAEGNIEYYVCTKCGKYFSDAEGKNEITKESTVISKLTAPTVKVKAVKNLKVTAKGKTYARVSWSKVSRAERYSVRVYRGGKRIAQNSTKNLTYKLTGLKKNTKYTIKVLAYNTQNGKKVYSNASEITVRTNK